MTKHTFAHQIDDAQERWVKWDEWGRAFLDVMNTHIRLAREGLCEPQLVRKAGMKARWAFKNARRFQLDVERLRGLHVTNHVAEEIILEFTGSWFEPVVDMLESLRDQDGTQGAQIAAECLQRVLPNITADEHKAIASDVLRYLVDGDDLDYEPTRIQAIHDHVVWPNRY